VAISRSSASKLITKPPAKRKKKKAKLGSGKRFKDVSKSIQKSSGKSKKVADAIAASIGRKKYGKKKFAALSAKGRKRRA
tara:strand:+ start:42 stop:281 length:240 start_codon:yes stop_codon:yes gene_type:complete